MMVEEEEIILVDEIRSLFGTASTMHLSDIAAGLAARRPQTWGQIDAKGLGALLRGLTPPIEPTTVYVADKSGAARTGKGLKREQLDTATTKETRRRQRDRQPPPSRVRPVISNRRSVRSDRPVRRLVSALTCDLTEPQVRADRGPEQPSSGFPAPRGLG